MLPPDDVGTPLEVNAEATLKVAVYVTEPPRGVNIVTGVVPPGQAGAPVINNKITPPVNDVVLYTFPAAGGVKTKIGVLPLDDNGGQLTYSKKAHWW